MNDTRTKGDTPFFFIGIGGIGMSAIARYLIGIGHKIAGYDRVQTPMTKDLEAMGVTILYEDKPEEIPLFCRTKEVVVVYTPAIPKGLRIRKYFEEQGHSLHKRAEILGQITQKSKALCVAGTHGKTTTSTILAHLLRQSHIGTSAFLGGIALNYGSNLLVDENSPYVVVEADEYDRSFHTLSPHIAIITATSADHLDIYHTEREYKEAFRVFASLVSPQGFILLHEDATLESSEDLQTPLFKYGQSPECKYRYSDIRYERGELYFDWSDGETKWRKLHLGTPIGINVVNATAAIAVAKQLGCTEEEIRNGLSTLKGAHRRFERVLQEDGIPILFDDYAHHPEEIEASLRSINNLYPQKQVTVVFQPHLYSRTRDFCEEFGKALSLASDVILLDIYPAREEPIPGVSSQLILSKITSTCKCSCTKENLLQELEKRNLEVLVMMGAGDIEFEIPTVRDYLLSLKR